jgi:hypothetical protein
MNIIHYIGLDVHKKTISYYQAQAAWPGTSFYGSHAGESGRPPGAGR